MDEDKTVRIGATAGDEMCNLYMMFYTKSQSQDQVSLFYTFVASGDLTMFSLSLR